MSPSHAGPFRKSARSCHWCYFSCSGTMCSTTGVSALPKSKSHLSANCRGVWFLLSSHRICWPFLCRPFLPAPSSWVGSLCLVSPSLQSRTQVPVSCLRSYCQPFRTLSHGKAHHSSGSCLWLFLLLFLALPLLFLSHSISNSVFLSLLSFLPGFPELLLTFSYTPVLLPPLYSSISFSLL
uniref:Uncharacterized protein n=1 Tax=Equus asinus TaxID=9793 RepID=A0A9L0I710_EQUAS